MRRTAWSPSPVCAASPMMLFARREHPLDVTVQGPHDADPRKHCRAADCRDQDQGFHRRLPLSGLMLGLWKLRSEFAGVLERDKLASLWQRNRFVERSDRI